MKISKIIFFGLLSVLTFASCSKDDPIDAINPVDPTEPTDSIPGNDPNYPYDHGFFVTNEGQFPGPGSITFVSEDLQTTKQHIFETVNGENPGSVIQSMFFDEKGNAYVIANNSNMISVVDRYTFERTNVIIDGLDLPRYGVVVNGKAYVTNQSSWETTNDDFVIVINLETLKVEDRIDMVNVEQIFKAENGKIYVQNGSFGEGNKISIIDPETNSVHTIGTSDGLNDIAIANNVLYALTATKIEKFELSGTKIGEVILDYGKMKPGDIDVEGDSLYYTVNKSVYRMKSTTMTVPETALLSYNTNSPYGKMYGFEVENNRIYVVDGGDFASDSFIEVYDLNGELVKKIDVGVGPNGVYFND